MRGAVRQTGTVLRYSRWDGLLVSLSIAHGAALVAAPSIPLVAVGLWWNANTVAHNFIHRPFFRSRAANRIYALWLSVVLGFPQSIWRERHLAHHAGRQARLRLTPAVALETALVVTAWAIAGALAPSAFLLLYAPGWALGLALCWLQGHYEHAHGTTSHYGRLYNALFFNDGYHIEHHLRPGRHWSLLAREATPGRASRWPPVLRWLDAVTLTALERVVLASPFLQWLVVRVHMQAFRRLLPAFRDARSVLIVGGGLFPRTAIVLRRLLPDATLSVVDVRAEHLSIARRFLDERVVFTQGRFTGVATPDVDLVVVPLAYLGDRKELYRRPPARITLVHDWIWSRHGRSAVVSLFLLKRVNQIGSPRCDETAHPVRKSA